MLLAWRARVFVLCFAMVLITAAAALAQSPAPPAVPQELLVKYRTGVTNARRQAALARVNARLLARFAHVGVDHIDVPAGVDASRALAALEADPDVLYVQPNYIRQIVATGPNDPSWLDNSLWGLARISAAPAWSAYPPGAHDVVVVVIDSGINYLHPDLAGSVWTNPGEIAGNGVDDDRDGYVDDVHGVDTLNRDGDPMDENGHGTHVAGTIGAQGNNGIGVVGVAWNPQIVGCKFLDASGSGPDSAAIACFDYAIDLKVNHGVNVRVTNNSWGFLRPQTGPFPQALKDAFDAAGQAGIVNVVAAGNNGVNIDQTPFDPASFTSPSIVTVGASDPNDAKAYFSNYGAASVDLAAPGVNILSTYGSGYALLNGTSMAAPHVTGAVALMASQDPSLTVSAIKAQLIASVDPLSQWQGLTVSGGRLNLFQALHGSAATPGPVAAIRRLQSTSASGAPTSALTFSFPSATTSGNALVVAVSAYYSSDPDTAISDSLNNTWKVAVNYANGARVKVYYAENITGGAAHQITLQTSGGPTYMVATAMEYAGLAGVGSLDAVSTNRSTTATYSSGLTATTHAPDLVIGVHHVFGVAASFTPAAGWATIERRTDGAYHQHQVQEETLTSAGSVMSSGTLSTTLDAQSVLVALKAGAADPAPGTPPDVTPPSVAITAPAPNASVSGSVLVSASASDDTSVAGVQFQLDGAPLGAEIATAPYRLTWDTTTAANGAHQLTAVARDPAGNRKTSVAVAVTVNNTAPAGIRRVQSTSGSGAPASTLTLVFSGATASGNALIVAVSDYYTADPDTTISDSRNNTWQVAANYANGARVKVYYATNISGGASHQITLRTNAAPAYIVATAMEYAGLATLDGAVTSRNTSASYSSGALTTTQAPDLLIGIHHVYSTTATFTPASGWSTVVRATDGSFHEHQVQERTLTSVGSVTSSGTLSAALDTQSVILALTGGAPDSEPPSAPTGLSATAISGSQVGLTWLAATDNVAVASYRILRNGAVVGTSTSTSYTDTGLQPGTTYTYAVAAVDAAGNASAASDPQIVTTLAPDTTPPTVAITSPAANATITGSVQLAANAADDTAVAGVQFQLDGAPIGAEITAAPYRLTWDTTTVGNGSHQLKAIARDAAGNKTADVIAITVSNTAPAIRLVQSTSASGAPASTVTLSFATTTSGNALIVAVSDYYTADPDTTISDSRSNTWQVATSYANGARLKVYYAANINGGASHQITLRTNAAPAYIVATAMEYAGVSAISPLDGAAGNRATSGTYSSAAVTTTSAPDLLIGIHHVYNTTTTFTPAAGWTTVVRATDGAFHEHQVQQFTATASGTIVSSGTLSAPADTQSVIVALKGGS